MASIKNKIARKAQLASRPQVQSDVVKVFYRCPGGAKQAATEWARVQSRDAGEPLSWRWLDESTGTFQLSGLPQLYRAVVFGSGWCIKAVTRVPQGTLFQE
jgi:hypothetical protein